MLRRIYLRNDDRALIRRLSSIYRIIRSSVLEFVFSRGGRKIVNVKRAKRGRNGTRRASSCTCTIHVCLIVRLQAKINGTSATRDGGESPCDFFVYNNRNCVMSAADSTKPDTRRETVNYLRYIFPSCIRKRRTRNGHTALRVDIRPFVLLRTRPV